MTSQARIIVVEDEQIVASDLKSSLERMGYQVAAIADSRVDALAAVAAHEPDLVLMDVVLRAGDDGIDTANEIRFRFNTPVLYLTAYADDDMIERAKQTEPIGYILKPYDDRELKANIELAISQYRSGRRRIQDLLAKTFEAAPDGLVAVANDGTIARVNQRLLDMFGYVRGELIGQPLEALVPQAVRAAHAIHRAHYVASPAPRLMGNGGGTFAGRRKDGTEIPVEISLSQFEVEGGYLVLAAVRDISERVGVQRQLEDLRARLQAVLASVPDLVIALDRHGTVRFLNREPAGRTMVALVGASWLTNVPADHHAALSAALASVFATGEVATFEVPALGADGESTWYAGRLAPIYDDQTVTGAVLIARDITEVRSTALRIREEQERFRATFEQAAVGIAHVDPTHRVQRVNARLGEILGVAPEAIVGRNLLDFVHPDDREAARASELAVLAGSDFFGREGRWLIADGTTRWVSVTRSLVRDAAGAPAYLVVVVEDIEARKRAEQQVAEAAKLNAIGQLAGGIAHDFNNMLSVILSYSELGAQLTPIGDPRRADLDQIAIAARRAAELTHQLLAFSRRQILQTRVEDLAAVVRANEPLIRRLVREDIELSFVLPAEPMRVTIDAGQLAQLLFNLVINARDAIRAQGTIMVEVGAAELDDETVVRGLGAGRYVTLTVTDSGSGMDRATQDRVFEPFFTTKTRGQGTGLGLATAFGFVKQSGGGIFVYSEVGRGTTFKIYLPQTDGQLEAPPTSTGAILTSGGGEMILLVEDDPLVREATVQVLRRGGYHVLEAQGAGEALLQWEAHAREIELVLTDVVMPHLGGPELVARLHRAGRPPKVLYMSGYAEHAIVHRGELEAGVAFISKPLTPKTLLAKIRTVLAS